MKFIKFAFALIVALFPVIVYLIRAQGDTGYNRVLLDQIYPVQDDSALALMALAAMYTPMENEAGWSKMLCKGMTEGGCNYFKDHQAAVAWKERSGNIGSSSRYIETVAAIDESTELWQAQVTVFMPDDEKTSDFFVLVRRGDDGRWRLDRIISGPGVLLP